MKKIVIIQARMGSTRFPGKVLEKLLGKPILQWVVEASQKTDLIDDVIVATSTLPIDLPIVEWCKSNGVSFSQGSEEDVLDRYYQAAMTYKADIIVRVTSDCPLLQPDLVSQVLYLVSSNQADYASNTNPPTWPDGLDCEAFTFKALEYAHKNATRSSDREHVTPFIRNHQKQFKCLNVDSPAAGLEKHRWTVDAPADLTYVQSLVERCDGSPTLYRLLDVIEKNPDLIQPAYQRNEGFVKSLISENVLCEDFSESQSLLKRALKVIPVGSQTFSKSYIQYPQNTAPLFLTHGQGAKVWDVDGNEYVDFVNALFPNILGYQDPNVNLAIKRQLNKGISFSLSTELEIELAEKLVEIIPSAEMVRFAKNGTDVTSASVRLARAYTGRDKMIVCGYHGWQDWSIGTTSRNKGIPQAVCDLSVSVPYNDLQCVEDLLKTGAFAGLIMEPCNVAEPNPGYLQGIKDLCERYGSVFIFDEIVTGFRFALGGAQEYFGVTPHLSCFGKAMGNGMPISAIVGRKDIMREMEDIFFSGTFGGEALSLAAALTTIKKLQEHDVISYLWKIGQSLENQVTKLVRDNQLDFVIKLVGFAPWKIMQFLDHSSAAAAVIKTYFLQEMLKRGVLILGSHNVSFAHGAEDEYRIVAAYKEVLPLLNEFLKTGTLESQLKSPVIQPLFKVR